MSKSFRVGINTKSIWAFCILIASNASEFRLRAALQYMLIYFHLLKKKMAIWNSLLDIVGKFPISRACLNYLGSEIKRGWRS